MDAYLAVARCSEDVPLGLFATREEALRCVWDADEEDIEAACGACQLEFGTLYGFVVIEFGDSLPRGSEWVRDGELDDGAEAMEQC